MEIVNVFIIFSITMFTVSESCFTSHSVNIIHIRMIRREGENGLKVPEEENIKNTLKPSGFLN